MSKTAPSPTNINPFFIAIAVSLAAFMEVLDTTIANVALSHIAGSLGASSEESTWVLTTYLVSNGIVMPLSGWLSNLMGRKNFFIFCILGFTFTSFMCGIANSLPMLILFRLLQGLAGGGLQPVQQAIIKDSFPPEKLGMAFAITSVTMVVAPILGPTLGGYITDSYSWRWIFFINIPVGILAAFLVRILVQDPPTAQRKAVGTIDYIGISLVSLGLGTLQVILDKGQQEDWFDSSFIIVFACISFVSLILAVFWLLRQKNPVIDLKLFAIPSFSIACIMIFSVGFTLWASTALLPMLVQENFGYDATLSGLLLSPSAISVILMLPVVGKLVKVIQSRYLIAFGMFINATGMWLTGFITPQTDYSTFVLVRCMQTAGLSFLYVPISVLAFSKISLINSSNASAIFSLMRNMGGSIGIALITSRLVHSQQIQQANLVPHLTAADPGYCRALSNYTQTITNLGVPAAKAATTAMGHIYQELLQQATILAYLDAYHLLAIILIVSGIAALFVPNNIQPKKNEPDTVN
jgi:DHA2 family multidrug resistance protein